MIRILFAAALFISAPITAWAECNINGQFVQEGETAPGNECLICDSAMNAMAYSQRDCRNEDFGSCNVAVCDPTQGCVALALPARTRCSEANCEDGVVTQSECDGEGICVEDASSKTCNGFACLNENTCAEQCNDDRPCRTGFECIAELCRPIVNADMGPDMADMGNADTGSDMTADVRAPDVGGDTGRDGGADLGNDTSPNPSPTSTTVVRGTGCASTDSRSSLFVLLLALCIGLRRLRRRVGYRFATLNRA